MPVAFKAVGSTHATSSNSPTQSMPSHATGDLLLAVCGSYNGKVPNSYAGWTFGATGTGGGTAITYLWKIAASSSETFGITFNASSTENTAVVLSFTGCSATDPVFGYTACSPGTSSTLSAPSITSTSADSMRVVAYITRTWDDGYNTGGMTVRQNYNGGSTHPGVLTAEMPSVGASGATNHPGGPTSGASAFVLGLQSFGGGGGATARRRVTVNWL